VEREVCVVRSSAGCEDQPCIWVHREERREKERDLQANSTDRTVRFHLIYYKAHLCGCSPRERVNHVYLVVVCDWCCVLCFVTLMMHY
jgi:hypothetical protein